jgi:hypothetical protein
MDEWFATAARYVENRASLFLIIVIVGVTAAAARGNDFEGEHCLIAGIALNGHDLAVDR